MKKRFGFLVLFSATLMLSFSQNALANVVGSDYEIFNPNTDGVDFLTVDSAATLKPGQFNLGIVIGGALSPNPDSFPGVVEENSHVQHSIGEPTDYLIVGHFSLGVGLMEGWSLGLSFPVVIQQWVANESLRESNIEGLLEVRANTKFRFLGNDRQGMALVGRVNFNTQEPNPFVGDDPPLIFGVELVANADVANWMSFAFNAGYQWRAAGDVIPSSNYIPLNNMITGSVALGFHFSSSTSVLAEFYGAGTTEDSNHNTDRVESPFEVLLGMKHDCGANGSNIHYGIGTELTHGINTADWRAYAGVNWHFGGMTKAEPKYTPPPPPKPMPMPSQPAPEPDPQPSRTITVKNINFASGSAVISKNAATQNALDQVVRALKQAPFKTVEIAGHTDASGSDAMNKRLSQKRADAIKADIVRRGGFSAGKLNAVGYGEAEPVTSNATPAGRAQNRRVEFKIFD